MTRMLPGFIFWGWNALFLVFIALILFSGLIPAIFMAVAMGDMPVSFFLSILLLFAAPPAAIAIALKRKTRDGGFLLRLFFGVELPIFLTALGRLFVLRQMTAGTVLLLVSIAVACFYFLWSLYFEKPEIRSRIAAVAHAVPAAIMVVVGIGSAAFLAIYAPPSAVALAKFLGDMLAAFFSFEWLSNLESLLSAGYFGFVFLVFMALFLFSAVVFVVAPFFMAKYYAGAWSRVQARASAHIPGLLFLLLSASVGAAWTGAYGVSSSHREAETLAWLSNQEALADVRAEIETSRETIREDLLNAYLYRYRYLQARSDTNGVARLYRAQLGAPDAAADAVQSLHRFMLTPFLYGGERHDDRAAARLYHDIFDVPIQKAERAAIKKALQATWNRDEAEAGLLDINSKKVLVAEQHVVVEEFPTHASVEIEEFYENRTAERQEIYYYFALPEDAALTGLWLGFGPDRSKHDEFIVAPRGAAQEVYESEVRRLVDPALLEQVGPRQYRLRAFPVPPKQGRRPADEDAGSRLHMRFTYAVPRTGAAIAAPRLLEKRNVYWTDKTVRTVNGVEAKATEWMPPLPAQTPPANEQVIDTTVGGYRVFETPPPLEAAPLSLALLVDTSWSMRARDAALKEELAALAQDANIRATLYLMGAGGADAAAMMLDAFNAEPTLAYFGSLTPQEMLSQFKEKAGVDAIIILTDQGRYEADDKFVLDESGAPLWFVHFGLPAYAYDDAILDRIYSTGGGAASNIDEALRGIRAAAAGSRLAGGRAWRVKALENVPASINSEASESLAAIAARQAALALAQMRGTELATLDEIHALATNNDIVTPWSSMIVLVNERQREALEEASGDADRFSREANTGEENLTAPTVTGVPEPHEWMLLFIAAEILLFLWRRQRHA